MFNSNRISKKTLNRMKIDAFKMCALNPNKMNSKPKRNIIGNGDVKGLNFYAQTPASFERENLE